MSFQPIDLERIPDCDAREVLHVVNHRFRSYLNDVRELMLTIVGTLTAGVLSVVLWRWFHRHMDNGFVELLWYFPGWIVWLIFAIWGVCGAILAVICIPIHLVEFPYRVFRRHMLRYSGWLSAERYERALKSIRLRREAERLNRLMTRTEAYAVTQAIEAERIRITWSIEQLRSECEC